MESERLSRSYWEQVPHSELPGYASAEKTLAEVAALRRFVAPADDTLDLGCGWGRIACALAAAGYRVSGVDLSPNLIGYARTRAAAASLPITFDVGSLLAIPFADNRFDKIICLWGVFNHLLQSSEQLSALNEMYRVLRPGGAALIEMGNGERKKYRHIRATIAYGPEQRIWDSQFKPGTPPNVLYLHDRSTMTRLAERSRFARFRVRFQNINHRRRIVTYLYKRPSTAAA